MQYVLKEPFSTCTDRFSAIQSVTVAGHPAEFTIHDPLTNISMGSAGEAPDCHKHAELKRKLYSAMQECDEGELSIAMPKESAVRVSTQASSNGTFSESAWLLNVSGGS